MCVHPLVRRTVRVVALNIFKNNFIFKLVGDGVLILVPDKTYFRIKIKLYKKMSHFSIDQIFIKHLYTKLKNKNNNLNFRLVACYGTLYCISFTTANGTLKECIGKPISFLVKESKNVNTYRWFGSLD